MTEKFCREDVQIQQGIEELENHWHQPLKLRSSLVNLAIALQKLSEERISTKHTENIAKVARWYNNKRNVLCKGKETFNKTSLIATCGLIFLKHRDFKDRSKHSFEALLKCKQIIRYESTDFDEISRFCQEYLLYSNQIPDISTKLECIQKVIKAMRTYCDYAMVADCLMIEGDLRFKQKNHKAAAAIYLAIEPRTTKTKLNAWTRRGHCMYMLRNFEVAKECYQTVLVDTKGSMTYDAALSKIKWLEGEAKLMIEADLYICKCNIALQKPYDCIHSMDHIKEFIDAYPEENRNMDYLSTKTLYDEVVVEFEKTYPKLLDAEFDEKYKECTEWSGIACDLKNMKSYEKALRAFNTVLYAKQELFGSEKVPRQDLKSIQWGRAECLESLGAPVEAGQAFEEAASLTERCNIMGEYIHLRQNAGNSFLTAGLFCEAKLNLKSAYKNFEIENNMNSIQYAQSILDKLAGIYERENSWHKALKCLQTIISLAQSINNVDYQVCKIAMLRESKFRKITSAGMYKSLIFFSFQLNARLPLVP